MDELLIEILGKDAYYSTDFKVTDNVRLLAQTVRYLYTQVELLKQYMPVDDRAEVLEIRKNAIEILKGDRRE